MQCVNPDPAAHWRLTDIGRGHASHDGKRNEIWAPAEPYSRVGILNPRAANVPALLWAGSNQVQIDQRTKGGGDAGDDQGIVGDHVATGTERWVCFLGH